MNVPGRSSMNKAQLQTRRRSPEVVPGPPRVSRARCRGAAISSSRAYRCGSAAWSLSRFAGLLAPDDVGQRGDQYAHAVDVVRDRLLDELVVAREAGGCERDVELARRRVEVQHLHPREELGVAGEGDATRFGRRAHARV